MKIRHWFTVFCVTFAITSLALAGIEPKLTGGACPPNNIEGQAGDSSEKYHDPIYLATGDFQHTNTDLFIPGRGMNFEIKRFYRSKSGFYSTFSTNDGLGHDGVLGSNPRIKTPLGINWDYNYNMRLDLRGGGVGVLESPDPEPIIEDVPPDSIIYYPGNGRRDEFQPITSHDPEPGNPAQYGHDEYMSVIEYSVYYAMINVFSSDQTRYQFLPFYDDDGSVLPYAGRLNSITDRNGNQISFTYETSNGFERLASAIDTLGHLIVFSYQDNPNSPMNGINVAFTAPLIWKIADHAGREIVYEYENPSALYTTRLISATLPSIDDASGFSLVFNDGGAVVNHSRFPGGRKWQYEYITTQPIGWFNDGMLSKITDPNGEIITQNTYDTSFEDERRTGRVSRQVYGDEVYNYVVTDDEGDVTDTSDGYNYYVWVNDRRGVITRFKYAKDRSIYSDPAGGPDTPRDRQLLERKIFDGFVDNPDLQVWAVSSSGGEPTGWRYYDTNGMVQTLAKGPETPDGAGGTSGPWASTTTEYVPDRNWNVSGSGVPNGINLGQTYQNHDHPPLPGISPDPRFNRTVTSRTVSSDDGSESITEYWRYDFDFGGGCGCGSSGFETAYQDGKGYVTIKEYDSTIDPVTGNPSGDLLAIYHDLPIGASMETFPSAAESLAAAVDKYTYNEWGQVLTHTHPSKKIIDSQGDVDDHERVDQFEYYSNQADQNNYGRLHKKHIDVNGFDLVTTYVYDIIGNVIQIIEPDGDVTNFYYNQDAELVREQSYDDVAETTLFAQTDYFYDANGNLVLEEVLNLDGDQLLVPANKSITSVYEYDKLDYMTKSSYEAGVFTGTISSFVDGSGRFTAPITNSMFVSQIWEYDAAQNLIQFSDGEAVNGVDVTNIVTLEYDARELRIKTIVGPGSISPLVTEFEYDDEDRLVVSRVDPDNMMQSQDTQFVYDAFDRIVKYIDPLLNEYLFEYDNNHNPILLQVFGPVLEDTDTASGNVLLAEVSRDYEQLDLLMIQTVEVFDYNYSPPGVPMPASDPQITSYSYNADTSGRAITSPAGNGTSYIQNLYYDTASRLEFAEDVAGNITQYMYDADSNVSKISMTEISSIDGAVEIFEVEYNYDVVDRRVEAIDGVGNSTKTKFDSRSNTIEIEDARNKLNLYTYDSMSRLVSTSLGNGTVTTTKGYDASSRLVSEVDANGNETNYEYDGLNRLTKIIMPDEELYQAQYDSFGNMSQYTDARGVVVTQNFDLNNRIYNRVINDSAVLDDSGAYLGIPGTASEDYTYDGLGRLRTAENDFSKITREYDSRSNVTREFQNIDSAGGFPIASDREVTYEFDLANNTTQLTYPGGREIYRTFDALNRMVGIFNDDQYTDPITEFEYTGRRLQRREHGNGTRTDYVFNGINNGSNGVTNAAGDFGFGRVSGISTTKVSSGNTLDAFTFAWDKTQNRTVYNDTGSGMKNRRERTFGYDDANRLISTDVDFPDPLTDNTSPTNNGITSYTLDGVYNRTDVSGFESNGAPIGAYTQAGDQAKNNQYTLTPRAAGGEWINFHDENGNLIQKYQSTIADFNGDYTVNFFDISAFLAAYNALDPTADVNNDGSFNFLDVSAFLGENSALDNTQLEQWYYSYDFRNQLIEAKHVFGPTSMTLRSINTYDAAARRVIESLDADGDGLVDTEKQLVYGCTSLWEVIEQIDIAMDTTILTHVYGLGIDDEISYQYEELSGLVDIWAHRDDLNSLTSISDSNGDVLERYEYGDYGKVTFFSATGLSIPFTSYQAHHLYTGRSLITGTGLYDYRYRVMEPETGRFSQRDPLGTHDSQNLYTYAGNNSMKFFDPFGLFADDPLVIEGDPNETQSPGIDVDNTSDATKLINDNGPIENLNLSGHGDAANDEDGNPDPNAGGAFTWKEHDPDETPLDLYVLKRIKRYNDPNNKRPIHLLPGEKEWDDLLNAVDENLSDDGTLTLTACNAGTNSDGVEFGKMLSERLPGRTIILFEESVVWAKPALRKPRIAPHGRGILKILTGSSPKKGFYVNGKKINEDPYGPPKPNGGKKGE